MTSAHKALILGAVKSAVSSATALIVALPAVSSDFSISTWGGWKHLGTIIAAVIIVSEARYWFQWANTPETTPKP